MAFVRGEWVPLKDLTVLFGLSERAMLGLQREGCPIRRLTPKAAPGVIWDEFLGWLRSRPLVGRSPRAKGGRRV